MAESSNGSRALAVAGDRDRIRCRADQRSASRQAARASRQPRTSLRTPRIGPWIGTHVHRRVSTRASRHEVASLQSAASDLAIAGRTRRSGPTIHRLRGLRTSGTVRRTRPATVAAVATAATREGSCVVRLPCSSSVSRSRARSRTASTYESGDRDAQRSRRGEVDPRSAPSRPQALDELTRSRADIERASNTSSPTARGMATTQVVTTLCRRNVGSDPTGWSDA